MKEEEEKEEKEENEEKKYRAIINRRKKINKKNKERIKRFWLLSLLALVSIGALASGYYFLYKPEMSRLAAVAKAKIDAEAARNAAARAKAARAEAEIKAQAEAERQRKLKLATVGDGEGVIHAYARQLIDNPELVAGLKVKIEKEEYDLTFSGDKSESEVVKKWAQHTAYFVAIVSGYVEHKKDRKPRREIRVKKPGETAYLFVPKQKDSVKMLDIKIYQKGADETEFGVQTVTSVNFIGDPDYQVTFWASDKILSSEYIWTPKNHKKKSHKK